MIPKDYLERVYAGLIGKNAGIRLGAPLENESWTYERVRNTYPDIRGYVKEYKNFAADDDINGPVYFFRPLRDHKGDGMPGPEEFGQAWLNYAREGIGLYWWGGYGISTAHSVYLNLKNGVPVPQSGSIKQNGEVLAQQIGGQIFIDMWGLVTPGDPELAAERAQTMACVSHDGEALNGARFIAACISKAFEAKNVQEILEAGLSVLPKDCLYRRVAEAVWAFYQENPDDFRACRKMLDRDWGYDKYPGACHVIPNAGVCVLGLLYGKGDFNRTIEIAVMCAWDTDCNAGSLGSILGVFGSLKGIGSRYRDPINDSVVLSGISGYLNVVDLPTYAREAAASGYRLAGLEVPEELTEGLQDGELHFDFMLPGSTHNLRLSDEFHFHKKTCSDITLNGKNAFEVLFDKITRGTSCRIFFKPFYTREEFNDERYSPTFAPQAYSGQVMEMKVWIDQWEGFETVSLAPYARIAFTNEILSAPEQKLERGKWHTIRFTLPETNGGLIDEAGLLLNGSSPSKCCDFGRVVIGEFSITGKARFTIDPAKQKMNFKCVTPFSHNHGAWEIYQGRMRLMSCEQAQAFTGNYYSRDYCVTAEVIPQNGESHMVEIRAQGAMRGYTMGLCGKDTAAIYCNDFGLQKLAEAPFVWEDGRSYRITARAEKDRLTLLIDGQKICEAVDSRFEYGMFGAGQLSMGRTDFGVFEYEDL